MTPSQVEALLVAARKAVKHEHESRQCRSDAEWCAAVGQRGVALDELATVLKTIDGKAPCPE